jgi:hypothetical protein
MAYFQDEEEYLNISIRMVTNPYEEKRKTYFKKEEYYYQLPEDFVIGQTGKPVEDISATGFAQHAIIYIAADIKVDGEVNFSNIKLYPVICASKVPTLICKIPKSDFKIRDKELEIFFYIKIKPTLSAIFTYISRNFDLLHDDPRISKLSDEDMLILLRHKDLAVGHEDQVFKALCLWRYSRPLKLSYFNIFNTINWHY